MFHHKSLKRKRLNPYFLQKEYNIYNVNTQSYSARTKQKEYSFLCNKTKGAFNAARTHE